MWKVWRPHEIAGAWPAPAADQEPAGTSRPAAPQSRRSEASPAPACRCHRTPRSVPSPRTANRPPKPPRTAVSARYGRTGGFPSPRSVRCSQLPELRLAAAVRPGGVLARQLVLTGRLLRRRRRRCRWRAGPNCRGHGHISSLCGVGVGGGFLDVPQRDPGVQRGGDERMTQSVWPDRLGDPCAAGDPADHPPSAVPV